MKSSATRRLGAALTATNFLLAGLACASLVLYRLGLAANRAGDIVWFICVALGQSVLYLIAAWLVLRSAPARSTLLITLVFATLFRLSILFAPPYLSDDIYRYVWDGRVQAARINPYRYVPADDALFGLRDEAIYPKVNRRDYAHTIYPPVAEAIYLGTTRLSESVTWMKATMVLFEAIACWALVSLLASFGWPRQRVLIYAWSPLAVWEFAGSGHVDAAAIAFIALALVMHRRRMETAAGVALGCATLVKLFPLVLLPAFWERRRERPHPAGVPSAAAALGWPDGRAAGIPAGESTSNSNSGQDHQHAVLRFTLAFASTILVGYLPYLSVGVKGVLGFLLGYAKERGLVSGEQFYLLDLARRALHLPNLPNAAFVVFSVLVLCGIAAIGRSAKRKGRRASSESGKAMRAQSEATGNQVLPEQDFSSGNTEGLAYVIRAFALATAFTILLAPHFSWYFAWLVPFLCFLPEAPLLYLTVASFLLYGTWLGDSPDQMFALNSYLYVGCAVIGAISIWIRRHEWEKDHFTL